MGSHKILIVEPDAEVMELLVAAFVQRFGAAVTCVTSAEQCLDADMLDPHDLVVAELVLEGMNGIDLAAALRGQRDRPILLLVDDPTRDEAISAMRAGVSTLFPKPFPVRDLLDSAEDLLYEDQQRRRQSARYHQLRRMVRRLLLRQRELNLRMDLVCKDLVGAHRRLVDRVVNVNAPGS